MCDMEILYLFCNLFIVILANVYTWTVKLPNIHCVQKKNTHSHFLSYLQELFVDLNKNCSEYTQGLTDSDNVKIRYSL